MKVIVSVDVHGSDEMVDNSTHLKVIMSVNIITNSMNNQ